MRIRHLAVPLLAAILGTLPTAGIAAHPHIWIDTTLDFRFDGDGLTGVRVSWLFDEFNSADMLFTLDENLDGEISAAEQDLIRQNAFEHLIATDYFLVVFAGTQQLDVAEARDFRATVVDGRLLYEFTVPLRVAWRRIENLVVGAFDTSYFIDFLSEPARERYDADAGTVRMRSETLRLASEGYGTIPVPAVRVDLN